MTLPTFAAALLAALPLLLAVNDAGAAPRDLSRHPVCASFARNATAWSNKARAQGCRLSGAYGYSEGQYHEWCMGTSDASFRVRSPQALGHKANLEKACGKQLKRPIRL